MVDGWDICIDNIGDAMRKAKVLDVGLQDQVYDKLSKLNPRPSIYDPDYIAANQVSKKNCLLFKNSFYKIADNSAKKLLVLFFHFFKIS